MPSDLAISNVPSVGGLDAPVMLSGREKAALVVRLLLADGAVPSLSKLPESTQTQLAIQLARMAPVDRRTMEAVATEFAEAIESIGLTFPGGLEDALGLLDGVISASASSRVRTLTAQEFQGDPWEAVTAVETHRLVAILEREAIEVAAIILSKLKVSKAAELLTQLPGERARRITYAVSLTGAVAPETVRRIGISLADELETKPRRAFADGPVSRVGAILNSSPASTRDSVLTGLDDEDAEFAEQVRKAIFTFANIRERVSPRDVPKIQQGLDQNDLITAAAFAEGEDAKSVRFIFDNISQRLADSLRTEASEKGAIANADGEAALMRIVNHIRVLENSGDIFLVADDD